MNMRLIINCVLGWLIIVSMLQCKKPYEPVALTKADSYLVVDGFINTSAGGVSTIVLSRTKALTDTSVNIIPEHGAQVTIQSNSGASYPLSETGNNGSYSSTSLSLNATAQYKLSIQTSNGSRYESDLVSVKPTPAIDSVTWLQTSKGLNLYVNTHDATNNTRYYRWDYTETWEYHSQLHSVWGAANGMAYVRTPAQMVDTCYNTTLSKNILLGNSVALGQDVISNGLLNAFVLGDSTLTYRSSFLVRQYALTDAAYLYWQIIQKNSQELGSLFDLQPSQLEGNIHSISNPAEPVVGFVSATNMQQQRMFINGKDLVGWPSFQGSYNCIQVNVPVNTTNFLILDNPDPSYGPYYYITGGPLVMAKNVCLDCTLSGGVTAKPSFW